MTDDAPHREAGQRLLMRDVSRAGHELGRAQLVDLPDRLRVRDVLSRRIRSEVTAYNAAPGPVYVGFVQPQDAIRYSDGHRMRRPRLLDADRFVLAAQQAVAAGLVAFRIGDDLVADLDAEVAPGDLDELVAVLQRPVVAADG